ncbi:MAG: carboxypeptidase-like regulatory domain-containing protein [Saprospiraceae bacterium]
MRTLLLTLSLLASISLFGQSLTQTIRGQVKDVDSQETLIGATVSVLGFDSTIGDVTDQDGAFKIENLPLGRLSIKVSYIGYESATIPNLELISAKEVVLTIELQESVATMDEVVVTASDAQGDAINDMALVSARSISAETTQKFAGGFSDPSRIVTAFAGVATTQDGDNDIIIRGNSPKYMQWRLEGMDIANPTHFADQNSVRGGVSLLNNFLLGTSDFHTGAFSAEFGDALSGVYDVRLRNGNNQQFEASVGLGLLGTDIMVEGPLKKGSKASFLANYRYSTIGLVGDLGIIDLDGVFNFQDATFKFVVPTEKVGTFNLFGLGGLSGYDLNDVTPVLQSTPGGSQLTSDLSEDYTKDNHTVNLGLNHIIPVSKNGYLRTAVTFANSGIQDDVIETRTFQVFDEPTMSIQDSVGMPIQNFDSRLRQSTYRASIKYNQKVNAKNKVQAGIRYSLIDYRYLQSLLQPQSTDRFTVVDMDPKVSTLNQFVNWKHRANEQLTVVAGVHSIAVLLNNKFTVEPRLAADWKLTSSSTLSAAYGLHSKMETIHNYFARVEQPNGSIATPNLDLDLLKANHFVLGYDQKLRPNMRAKVEVYYQGLFNLPVENIDTSYYSTINEGTEFRYVDLVNEGTGKNFGVELTVERFLNKGYYFLLNGSVFSAKYTALDGVERNTQYNGNYIVNLLAGKEWTGMGKKENQSLSLNGKAFFGGGKRQVPLLRNAQGDLAVDPTQNRYFDYSRAFEDKIEDVYTLIVSASYKWDKPKVTHELYLNLENLTNTKGRLSEFYDENEPGSVGYVRQFGLFPNLMYRIHF